jgi:uncharacterized protein YabN with tetrapyrrole methylase and pyrophosphatase domain
MFDERLVVLGTGIRVVGQLTVEAMAWVRRAEKILHLVEDGIAVSTLQHLNPTAAQNTLAGFYQNDKPRAETYEEMVQAILASVRSHRLTVCAFYGHPGVMAFPSHESIRRARAEGFKARMLPGISAEDCLFADLGIDPATHGCQTYEATDVLWNNRQIVPTTHLVLWQVGAVGDMSFQRDRYDLRALPQLVERLLQWYPPTHEVTIYEAALMLGCEPLIHNVPLAALNAEVVTARSTLSVPPIAHEHP